MPESMNRRKPHAASGSVATMTAALCGAVLLLSACCLRPCEGFASPLKLSSSSTNGRAAGPRSTAMSREICSGSCLLTTREGWPARRRAAAAGTFFPAGLRAAADGQHTATATAATASTDFVDPLGGEVAPAAVVEGVVEEKAAPKRKRKAAPRKKVRQERAISIHAIFGIG